MGLPHGRERRLAWAEVLPLLAVGVVAGCVVGVVVPNALAPALDLAPFTGAVTRLPSSRTAGRVCSRGWWRSASERSRS